jgi:N-acetylmuramoyl-L-alanine amidase
MLRSISKRIPETIALALCIGLLLAVWTPVYGQAYLVKPGDSLWKISRHFGISISSIQEENGLAGDLIMAGQTLQIPSETYVVQRGDSLYLLAQRHETTINAIKEANNLSGSLIMVGQTLQIPSVATQSTATSTATSQRISATRSELDLLARAVFSEARGETFQGQVAVAAVIINRVLHPEFPNSINGVIFEPWAFTAVHDGQFWLTPNQTAYVAVREALNGSDPSRGAIFYYNPITATNQWIRSRPIILQIGRHVFAR